MRKPLVAGNWKMHGDISACTQLLDTISSGLSSDAVGVAVFPPFVYLSACAEILKGSMVLWGAQNVSKESQGAFTGEVAADMLTDFNCHYVLAGHSERRSYYGETNEIVAEKFVKIQTHDMIPVLCVGETLVDRDAGRTMSVIKAQLDAVLTKPRGIQGFSRAVVAYEPVWAIGTGKTATPEMAQEVHQAIRDHLAVQDAQIANHVQILYGGSVKPDNAKGLFAMPDIDGALVGGASLKANDFLAICAAAID